MFRFYELEARELDAMETTEYKVEIPPVSYTLAKFKQESLPGVALINDALLEFEPKVVFSWHLSVMLHLPHDEANEVIVESEVLDSFEDDLTTQLTLSESKKPNGVILGRVTWNNTREIIYRIHDPETADSSLAEVIQNKSHPYPMDYRIDEDAQWDLAKWHLDAVRK